MRTTPIEIGPVKYDKVETTIFVKSYFVSLLVGLPIGALVNYVFGFPALPKSGQAPTSFIDWSTMLFVLLMSLESLCVPLSLSIYAVQLKKYKVKYSLNNIGKCLLAIFVFIPFLALYVALIFSAIIVPFNYALPGLSFIAIFWGGALLFSPFATLFGAALLPSSPAGKSLRHFIRKLRKVIRHK